MGQIQQAVNSGLSGTAFLLRQSGLFDEHMENMAVNRAGEKALKEAQAKYDAKDTGAVEYDKLHTQYDTDKKVAQANAVEDYRAGLREDLDKKQSEIKMNMPKYRMDEIRKQAKGEVANEVFSAIQSLEKANSKKTNAKKVKNRMKPSEALAGQPAGFYTNKQVEDLSNGK